MRWRIRNTSIVLKVDVVLLDMNPYKFDLNFISSIRRY